MQNKKGYTLLEFIVVLAVIVVLAGLTMPTVSNYIATARSVQYNDYAKTIFLASQSYLANAKAAGTLPDFVARAQSSTQKVPEAQVDAAYYVKGNSFLMLSKETNTPAGDALLREMLEGYVADPYILNQSICVEYNPITGTVYSVCYSEAADYFSYDIAVPTTAANISSRSSEARQKNRFGYYASSMLTPPSNTAKLKESAIFLVNAEHLTCEWTDAEPDGATGGGEIIYTLKLYDATSNALLQTITIPELSVVVQQPNTLRPVLCTTTSYVTGAAVESTQNFWLYYQMAGASRRYVLVLDSIDTSINTADTAQYSIMGGFPSVGARELRAGVSAIGRFYLPNNETLSQNKEHTLFRSHQDGKAVLDTPRHLFNMHYDPSSSTQYTLTRSLDWAEALRTGQIVYQQAVLQPAAVLNADGSVAANAAALAFPSLSYLDASGQPTPFLGGFKGNGNTISNLYLTGGVLDRAGPTGSAGLFAQNKSTIENLTLEQLTLRGTADGGGAITTENQSGAILHNVTVTAREMKTVGGLLGGIAGLNAGTVRNCSVTVPLLSGLDKVGGVVGENTGTLDTCTAKVTLEGANYVGGIAGISSGTLQNCKATATIQGIDTVGGIAGENSGLLQNCTETTVSLQAANNVGGIVGHNKGSLLGSNLKIQLTGHNNVGGIVGLNSGDGTLDSHCFTHSGSKITGGSASGGAALFGEHVGGVIGKNESTTATFVGLRNAADVTGNTYVGGILGSNLSSTLEDCHNTGLILANVQYGGGIAGSNGSPTDTTAQILRCTAVLGPDYDNLSVGDLKALARGDYIGGIAGYNNGTISGTNAQISRLSSTVVGQNFVGGAVGHNDTSGVVSYCEVVGGRVVATGDFVGGYFGLNTSRHLAEVGTGKGLVLTARPALVEGRFYVGGAIGANLVSLDATSSTALTLQVDAGTTGQAVIAVEVAGGIIGYNGVLSGATDQQLRDQLDALTNRAYGADLPTTAAGASAPATQLLDCRSWLSVTADRYVGGMIGYNSPQSRLLVDNCINYGVLSVKTAHNLANIKPAYSYYIGGITGRNSTNGIIQKSSNYGKVLSLSQYTGGIAEVNDGKIIGCDTKAFVESNSGWVGGIVGLNGETNVLASVEDCHALQGAEIRGFGEKIGGIVGENKAIVSNCTAESVLVISSSNSVGGIVGVNSGKSAKMEACRIEGGRVQGVEHVGGIVGKNDANIKLLNLTSSATVVGKNFVGGIVGSTGELSSANTPIIPIIISCINTGLVAALDDVSVTDPSALDVVPIRNARIEVGGITGSNRPEGMLLRCVNEGTVVGTGLYTGGIVSYNDGLLSDCVAAKGGKVIGAVSAGGVVGLNDSSGRIELGTSEEHIKKVMDKKESTTGAASVATTAGTSTNKADQIFSAVISTYSGDSKVRSAFLGGFVAENRSTGAGQTAIQGISFAGDVKFVNKLYTFAPPVLDLSLLTGQYAGGIIGYNPQGQTVENCFFLGKLDGGNGATGGMVGLNAGTVQAVSVGVTEAALITSSGRSGGFIGLALPSSTISNLTNGTQLTVRGRRGVGGFVGEYETTGIQPVFQDLSNYAKVEGLASVGGFVGELSATFATGGTVSFRNCVNEGPNSKDPAVVSVAGAVKPAGIGNSYQAEAQGNYKTGVIGGGIGGIVGRVTARNVTFTNCENRGAVNGGGRTDGSAASFCVGGIVGALDSVPSMSAADSRTTLQSCVNSAPVTGSGEGVGGLLGFTNGEAQLLNSQNNAAVTLVSNNTVALGVGGLVGIANPAAKHGLLIEACKNNATVTGRSHVGGLVGSLLGQGTTTDYAVRVRDSQNLGTVATPSNQLGIYVGGLVGNARGEGSNAVLLENCINGDRTATTQKTLSGGARGLWRAGGILGGSGWMEKSTNADTNKRSTGKNSVTLTNCENLQPISVAGSDVGSGADVGGILGFWQGEGLTLTNCTNHAGATVTIAGKKAGGAGGIVGAFNHQGKKETSIIQNSINHAAVSSTLGTVGGVVGFASLETNKDAQLRVEACTNHGAVSATGGTNLGGIVGHAAAGAIDILQCNNAPAPAGAQKLRSTIPATGGIVGTFSSTGTIKGCTNTMPLDHTATSGTAQMGGLVGVLASGTVEDSTNLGAITTQMPAVGGLVGTFTGVDVGHIQRCENRAAITASTAVPPKDLSGIGGLLGEAVEHKNPLTLQESSNTGAITVDYAAYVGGAVGQSNNGISSAYRLLVNTGGIQYTATAWNRGVGGIIGWIRTPTRYTRGVVEQCANFGDLSLSSEGATDGFGGVVGKAEYADIFNCYNFGNVGGRAKSGSAGGIVGLLFESNSSVRRSINAATIDLAECSQVGGVAGKNEGSVISSQNLILNPNVALTNPSDYPAAMEPVLKQALAAVVRASADKGITGTVGLPFWGRPEIKGKNNVGGIVGLTTSRSSKQTGGVYSTRSEASTPEAKFDAVRNQMTVYASGGGLGGIAGRVEGGSVTTAWNTGNLVARTGSMYVGGIAGYVESTAAVGEDALNAGGVLGCFNTGAFDNRVPYTQGNDKEGNPVGTRGALVGFRAPSSKESFGVQNSFSQTVIPTTIIHGNEGQWRIGNESYGAGIADTGGAADAMRSVVNPSGQVLYKLDQAEFSEDFLSQIGTALPPLNWTDPAQVATFVGTYLRNYQPKLATPSITQVQLDNTMNTGGYTVWWTLPPGPVQHFELYYDILDDDGVTVLKTLTTQILVDKDRVHGQRFPNDSIGRQFQVRVKAFPQEDSDGKPLAKPSGSSAPKGPYPILAPLLTPQVRVDLLPGTTRRFTITNLHTAGDATCTESPAYDTLGQPRVDYPNIAAITDPAYVKAYEFYQQGLSHFEMRINDGATLTFQLVNGEYVAEHTFDLADGVEKEFTLNFSAYAKAPEAGTDYTVNAYFRSNVLTQKLKVVQARELVVTTPLIQYTGDLETPAYAFSFVGDKNASSYELVIQIEGVATPLILSLPKGTTATALPKELWDAANLGKSFTVTAIAKGDQVYWLDSQPIAQTQTLVTRLPAPSISANRQYETAVPTDRYAVHWSGQPNGGEFVVSVTQTDRKNPSDETTTTLFSSTAAAPTKKLSYEEDYTYLVGKGSSVITNGYLLGGQAQQLGVLGVTLNSPAATLDPKWTVYPRLPLTNEPPAVALKAQPDGTVTSQLLWVIDWADVLGADFDPALCAGFEVYTQAPGETEPRRLTAGIASNVTSIEQEFDPDLAEQKIEVFIRAIGIDGSSSDSVPSKRQTITLAARAPEPTLARITPAPPTDPQLEADLNSFPFTLAWDKYVGVAQNAGFELEIVDAAGEPLYEQKTASEAVLSLPFTLGELARTDADGVALRAAHYAGQTVTLRVRTTAQNKVPSKWAETTLVIPPLKLQSPQLTYSQSLGELGTLTWQTVAFATDYAITALDKDGNPFPQVPALTLIPPATAGDDWGCVLVEGLTHVEVVAIGEAVDPQLHYVTSDAAMQAFSPPLAVQRLEPPQLDMAADKTSIAWEPVPDADGYLVVVKKALTLPVNSGDPWETVQVNPTPPDPNSGDTRWLCILNQIQDDLILEVAVTALYPTNPAANSIPAIWPEPAVRNGFVNSGPVPVRRISAPNDWVNSGPVPEGNGDPSGFPPNGGLPLPVQNGDENGTMPAVQEQLAHPTAALPPSAKHLEELEPLEDAKSSKPKRYRRLAAA